LAANPGLVNQRDDEGWTFLHREALAGNAGPVKVLLDHGADFTLRTKHGATALQLAHVLGWEKVVALLMAKGAKG
jgi:ankyrin repeat protein